MDDSPSFPPKRGRGAPPGNTNALKHGFYSRRLKRSDLSGIEYCDARLQEEITMLRVFTRRVIELGKDVDTLPEAVSLLRALCLASTSLTRLMKTQHLLTPSGNPALDAFHQALDEVVKELGKSP
jgi:hypothetical protein